MNASIISTINTNQTDGPTNYVSNKQKPKTSAYTTAHNNNAVNKDITGDTHTIMIAVSTNLATTNSKSMSMPHDALRFSC